MMKTTAIIVNYFTSNFLPPLLEVLNNDAFIHTIVIVDNSNEVVLKKTTEYFSKVRLLQFEKNVGFGAAINCVAKKYKADYYLLVNPDTLPEVGLVENLIKGIEDSDALIAGPRFYWDDEKSFRLPPALGYSWGIQNAMQAANHTAADAKLASFDWSIRHERFWKETEPFYEPFLSGACLLIKNDTSFFKSGEFFDERFFLYYEDTDLCMKALLQNKTMVCVPKAEIVHYWNQSPSEKKGTFMTQSQERFIEKYYGTILNLSADKNLRSLSESNITDLGEITSSSTFEIQNIKEIESYFFELGLNSWFVPFAQTDFSKSNFQITEQVWNHLSPGEYFCRIRNTKNQTLKTWKWKKH